MRATKRCRPRLLPALCLVALLPCLKVAGQDVSAAQGAQRTADYTVVKRVKPLVDNWLSAAAQSQEALQELLDNPNHRVDVDFLAARLAHLRGDPTMAIEILDRVIERKGKEKAPGLNMPAWVAAALYRGTVARHHGDWRVARDSYEQLLDPGLAGERFITPTVRAMSNLYLAEVELAMGKNPKDIIRRLDLVRTAPVPKQENMMMLHAFYVDWATYLQAMVEDGAVAAQQALVGKRENQLMPLLAYRHLVMAGIAVVPDRYDATGGRQWLLEVAMQNRASRVDRSLACSMLGFFAQQKNRLDIAAKCYRQLFLSNAFLAPDGGVVLVVLLDRQGKTEEANAVVAALLKRFPKYKNSVEEVRKKR